MESKTTITRQDLLNFEKDIRDNYEDAKIRAPVHLAGGNENELIGIFDLIKDRDWVFSTHRSHYHAILKTKDMDWVRKQIFMKRSSHINSKKHKFFTSAIVGGICPIALGVAKSIKLKKSKEHVWCFVGDMASNMGIFFECVRYAAGFKLPITFVVEDNGIAVYTPTDKVWPPFDNQNIIHYKYKRIYPHYGIGKWINF